MIPHALCTIHSCVMNFVFASSTSPHSHLKSLAYIFRVKELECNFAYLTHTFHFRSKSKLDSLKTSFVVHTYRPNHQHRQSYLETLGQTQHRQRQ